MNTVVARSRRVLVAFCAVVVACGALLSMTTGSAHAVEGGYIEGYHSGKYIEDGGGGWNSQGNQMVIEEQAVGATLGLQAWETYAQSPCGCGSARGDYWGRIMLQQQKSLLCLDDISSGANKGAVAQWKCNTNDEFQWWDVYYASNGYYVYANEGANQCMTVSGYSTADGAKVEVYGDVGCYSTTNTSYWWRYA
jgi:hypothetical protein